MSDAIALLPELDDVIRDGSPERRAETVDRITGLFLAGADRLGEEHVALFDAVFARLVDDIEARARAELSRRLAPVPNAPPGLAIRLASDEDIEVAGPMLQQSPRLGERDLLSLALTKGQPHLLAISGRATLTEGVSDVLANRGDREVVRKLAANAGARLSDDGFATLVKRADRDGVLAERVGLRRDLPKALFRRLVVQATAVVQSRLMAQAPPELRAEIVRVMTKVADEYAGRRDYTEALGRVADLAARGELDESTLADFARGGDFEATMAALAQLSNVPITAVDRLAAAGKPDPILILCKALEYGWPTVAAVLSLRLMPGSPNVAIAAQHFDRLSAETARRVVQFWRARRIVAPPPAPASVAISAPTPVASAPPDPRPASSPEPAGSLASESVML